MAEKSGKLAVLRAEGQLVARCSDDATRCSRGAAQRHSLGTGWMAQDVVEFGSTSAKRKSIGSRWRSSFFAVLVLHELLVKLFESVKRRACPGVEICKVLPSDPFRSMRKRWKQSE